MKPKQIQRFMSKIIKIGSCWIWTAYLDKDGYGQFSLNDKPYLAHRISYELFKEDIPLGLQLDHLCRVRHCVNPDHLEAVTCKVNIQRGLTGHGCHISGKDHFESQKTICLQGHEYNEKNTYHSTQGKTRCRVCHNITQKRYLQKLKENKVV